MEKIRGWVEKQKSKKMKRELRKSMGRDLKRRIIILNIRKEKDK